MMSFGYIKHISALPRLQYSIAVAIFLVLTTTIFWRQFRLWIDTADLRDGHGFAEPSHRGQTLNEVYNSTLGV